MPQGVYYLKQLPAIPYLPDALKWYRQITPIGVRPKAYSKSPICLNFAYIYGVDTNTTYCNTRLATVLSTVGKVCMPKGLE